MSILEDKLYIYIIHTQNLTNRALRSHGNYIKFAEAAKSLGFKIIPILILKHDPSDLQQNIEKLQENVKRENINDPDFDNHNKIFNIQMISNIEKHKEAWKRIYSTEENDQYNNYYLILEDDVFIVKDSIEYFIKLLNIIKTRSFKWDMIFLGIPYPDDTTENLDILNYKNNNIKILPSKEAYFITQRNARRLYDTFSIYKYILRVHLSYIFYTYPNDYNIYYTNKRITIDGSKVGIFPSSIHEINHLIYNNEYMALYNYYIKSSDNIQENFNNIKELYDKVIALKNTDFDVLYAKILIKINKLYDAKNVLLNGLNYYKSSQGIVNNRSELVNLLIDISGKTQDDIDNLLSLSSKFENIDLY